MGGIDLCFARYEYEGYPLKEPFQKYIEKVNPETGLKEFVA